MKKIKSGGKNSSILETVGGKTGQSEVVEEFKKVYQDLYNSADTSEAMKLIKDNIRNAIDRDSLKEADKITGYIVKTAAIKMKPKKGDVSSSFTSDVILNAPDIYFDHLAKVFRSWLVHGNVSPAVLSCAFLPYFKGGLKDPALTSSYRAIASSSLNLKLFDNVILLLWGDKLATDSLQFGFKAGTSTSECSWLVTEVANHFLDKGSQVIMTLLDCALPYLCL